MKPLQLLTLLLVMTGIAAMLTLSVDAGGKKEKEKPKAEHKEKAVHKEKAPAKEKGGHKDKNPAKEKGEHKEKNPAKEKAEHKEKGKQKTDKKTEKPEAKDKPANQTKASAAKPANAKDAKKSPELSAHHEAQKKSNEQLVKAFHMLQQAKIKLEKLDHDYGGHRKNAVQEIATAQNYLRKGLADYGDKLPAAGFGDVKGGGESRKRSNEGLTHALAKVREAAKIIHLANHDYFHQRSDALERMNKAISALEGAQRLKK